MKNSTKRQKAINREKKSFQIIPANANKVKQTEEKRKEREQIKNDVEEFIKNGGKIQKL